MNWIKKHLIKIGLALIVVGFIYEIVFAGVPYQDPTEEMVIRYNRNELISITIMQIGLAALVAGILVKVFSKKRKNVY
ncbi:hypothetical protein FLLO111716_01630 [Flavobacterium longum]|uniref:hypothetical protein n=1 Tax=Flavobacterium longum TaxID=1299340 RepID=UPI0039E8B5C3